MTVSHAARRAWYSPRSIVRSIWLRPRLYSAVLAALGAVVVMPQGVKPAVKWALVWDVGGVVYLGMAFWLMYTWTSDRIKSRAARADESDLVILTLILIAILASLAALTGLAGEAKEAPRAEKLLYLGLAAATLLTSWLVTQVVFTFHYARAHFARRTDGTVEQALAFPGDDNAPDYGDFFYFATSIGATSQTSDVVVRTKAMRRLVTLHAIVSFLFNTMVLAITINIAAGLI